MILVFTVLVVLLALAVLALGAVAARYDGALRGQLAHERAVNAERHVRVVELEQLVDRLRVKGTGVELPDPGTVAFRAHAAAVEQRAQSSERHELPREIEAELRALEDPEAEAEMRELAQYRLAQGATPESVLAELTAP